MDMAAGSSKGDGTLDAAGGAQAIARHDGWLRTVLFARLADPQAVDEVMQEVALAAVRSERRPDTGGRLSRWLYRVALRQVLLYRRRQRREERRVKAWAERRPHESSSEPVDPLDWLLAAERSQMVREGLGRLGQRDRELLLLKYGEGWTHRVMAERLGLKVSAVEARLHRARKRLREELSQLAMDGTEDGAD